MIMDSQLYSLQAKKTGIKLTMARQKSGLSVEDLAQKVGLDARELRRMEQGLTSLSLPQLQNLASILDFPIADIVNPQALAQPSGELNSQDFQRLEKIRDRILGLQIKQNRQKNNLSIDQLSLACNIAPNELEQFETGTSPIPYQILNKISEVLGLSYQPVPVSEPALKTEPVQQETAPSITVSTPEFPDLTPELREFISKSVNIPYLELAMKLSKMDAMRLRDVAESLLEITL